MLYPNWHKRENGFKGENAITDVLIYKWKQKSKKNNKQKNYWNYLKLVSLAYLIYGPQHYTIL